MNNNLPIGIVVTGRTTWNKNILAEFLDKGFIYTSLSYWFQGTNRKSFGGRQTSPGEMSSGTRVVSIGFEGKEEPRLRGRASVYFSVEKGTELVHMCSGPSPSVWPAAEDLHFSTITNLNANCRWPLSSSHTTHIFLYSLLSSPHCYIPLYISFFFAEWKACY